MIPACLDDMCAMIRALVPHNINPDLAGPNPLQNITLIIIDEPATPFISLPLFEHQLRSHLQTGHFPHQLDLW